MGVSAPIVPSDGLVLVTGSTGFVGRRVVERLLEHGFRRIRCFTRPSSDVSPLAGLSARYGDTARIEVMAGNLLSRDDCAAAVAGVSVIYHVAASAGGKSYPDAFMSAVITTRNLIEASLHQNTLKRFVNVSSFAVYTNRDKSGRAVLDEASGIEEHPQLRDPYCYAKTRQETLVREYGKRHGLPFVILRPGVVYGPGKNAITGRVGLSTFGFFVHLGGSNPIPFTYVDNCADAIVMAGVREGIDGETFNVVDDDLPSSRQFLRLYKRRVKRFRSVYLPRPASFLLCYLWEKGESWSKGQLPAYVNRRIWHAHWKGSRYSNEKLKRRVGWSPKVSMAEGLARFFQSCREGQSQSNA